MSHVTPQFDIKTGADSQLFFSREITKSDVVADATLTDEAIGRFRSGELAKESDIYNYPQMTRRTGHSIKGTTENIESNELRKGRTKSAPRKGNSSAEGSLDIELSPETYDDIFEAALRNKWKNWTSDANSDIKFDFVGTLATDQFISNGTEKDAGLTAKYLVGVAGQASASKDAVIVFESSAERAKYEIAELTCGTEDIKYSALAEYGGIEGEELYQEFQHLAVNTMSLSVSPGQIVTGSFGFMGANNPDLLPTGASYEVADPAPSSQTDLDNGDYYTRSGTAGAYTYAKATTFDGSATYYAPPKDLVESLGDDSVRSKTGRFFGSMSGTTVVGKTPDQVVPWVEDLKNRVGTDTDQFTAREGFLYINGHRVQYGSNLTLELNNGLKQIFAILEKGSISTTPLALDITGTLDAYLIKGYSEDLYNMFTRDKDVEIVFCFQDKEDNPDYLYVMQIFKAKFSDADISQGNEELTVSLPFQSFEERACRMFRIRKRKPLKIVHSDDGSAASIQVELTTTPAARNQSDYTVKVVLDGVDVTSSKNVTWTTTGLSSYKYAKWTMNPIAQTAADQELVITVTYNGMKLVSKSVIAHS